ncbi:MAG: nuclear transport factor 2 family protein [Candidatus Zixiibacteriota bacterium]
MYRQIVEDYFRGQNGSDKDLVVSLFAEHAKVYNVNLPPFEGKDRIRQFCEDLYGRTSKRKFELVAYAEGSDFAIAEWSAKLSFREGAKIGPWTLGKPFEVDLRGVNKFEFDSGSTLISCLRVYHETTTVAKFAQENQAAERANA